MTISENFGDKASSTHSSRPAFSVLSEIFRYPECTLVYISQTPSMVKVFNTRNIL